MAKLTFTVLFFLFAFSQARTLFDQTENEVQLIHDSVFTVPDPDSKTMILLPGQKPGSEPATVVALKPENTEFESESEKTSTESKEESREPVANSDHTVTLISFPPLNRRQFIRRSWPLSVRRARRCHLHRGQLFRKWGLRSGNSEIPYGNDMIVSGDDLSFVRASEGGVRQIPERWAKFHRVEPKNSYGNEMDVSEEIKRPDHRHHHHHHDRDHREGEEKEERDHDHRPHDREHKHEHKHEDGFVMKIRKFLNQF